MNEGENHAMATEMSYSFADLWQYSWKSGGKNKQTEVFWVFLENLKRKIVSLAVLIVLLMRKVS